MSEPSPNVLDVGVDTDLTKWPRLLVTGDDVTPEQAGDIILRTTEWYLIAGSAEWATEVYAALVERGAPAALAGTTGTDILDLELSRALGVWLKMARVLDLRFMRNYRIASSWLGGLHGWVDWDGKIGCSSYNIGKYPDVETVHTDLLRVASAFPYLNMRVQLVTDEGAGTSAVSWVVNGGEVAHPVLGDQPLITEPTDPYAGESLHDLLATRNAEWYAQRGVTIERLRAALGNLELSYV